MEEKRRSERYQIRLNTNIVLQQKNFAKPLIFITENISTSGIFIRGDRSQDYKIETNEVLDVWLYPLLSDVSSIKFTARVVHKVQGAGFGLSVDEIDPEERVKLDAFLHFYSVLHPGSMEDAS